MNASATNNEVVMGIDTSNYTTSVALLGLDGSLIANIKRPLPVKEGGCGLRQSEAVFAHVKNLPSAMDEARERLDGRIPCAVGVSTRPRNTDGSYMPCFLSGVAAAHSVAMACGAPIYEFSHQCGHIMAALYSSGREDIASHEFGAFHVSGGTTELLRVRMADYGFLAECVGGTADLNAGQVIDRVGVYMGLAFPAGAGMEAEALTYQGKIPRRKVSIRDLSVNLSGVENLAKKMFDESHDRPKVSAFVLQYVADMLTALSERYLARFGSSVLLYAGGVMSNSIIKAHLAARFDAAFAEPALSADNAVGIAELTRHRFLSENK